MDTKQETEARRQDAMRQEMQLREILEKEEALKQEALQQEIQLQEILKKEEALKQEALQQEIQLQEILEKEEALKQETLRYEESVDNELQSKEAVAQEAFEKQEMLQEDARQEEILQKEHALRQEVQQREAMKNEALLQEKTENQSIFGDLQATGSEAPVELSLDENQIQPASHENTNSIQSGQGIFGELAQVESSAAKNQEQLGSIGGGSNETIQQSTGSGMFGDLAPAEPETQSPEKHILEMEALDQHNVAQAAFALQMEDHGNSEAFDSLKRIEDERLNANEQARMDCADTREITLNNPEMTPEEKVALIDQADMEMREQMISNGETALQTGSAVIAQYSIELQDQYQVEQAEIAQRYTPEIEDTLAFETRGDIDLT